MNKDQENRDDAAQHLRDLADRVAAGKVQGIILRVVQDDDAGQTLIETWNIGSKHALAMIEANGKLDSLPKNALAN